MSNADDHALARISALENRIKDLESRLDAHRSGTATIRARSFEVVDERGSVHVRLGAERVCRFERDGKRTTTVPVDPPEWAGRVDVYRSSACDSIHSAVVKIGATLGGGQVVLSERHGAMLAMETGQTYSAVALLAPGSSGFCRIEVGKSGCGALLTENGKALLAKGRRPWSER